MKKMFKGKGKKILTIGLVTAAVLTSTTLTFAGCGKTNKPGPGPTPPSIVDNQIAVSSIYDEFVDTNEISQHISDCMLERTETLFPGYQETGAIESGNDKDFFVRVKRDNKWAVYAISLNPSAEDEEFFDTAAKEAVLEMAGYESDATVLESAKLTAKTQILNAVEAYKQKVDEIFEREAETAEVQKITDMEEINYSRLTAFLNPGGGKSILPYVSPLTPSMKCTSGSVETENCRKFLLLTHSGNGVYEQVVTVADRPGLSDQQLFDLLATGEAGKDYSITNKKLLNPAETYETPNLSEPELEMVSFDEVYSEVFGDFAFIDFNSYLNELTKKTLPNSTNVNFLFANLNNEMFEVYSSNTNAAGLSGLSKGEYRGSKLAEILNYANLSKDVKDSISFKEYVKNLVGGAEVGENTAEHKSKVEQMTKLQENILNYQELMSSLKKEDFFSTSVIRQTRDNIDHDAMGQKFVPEGRTPLYTYVGAMGGKLIDDGSHFGPGGYRAFVLVVIYERDGNLIIQENNIALPDNNNETTLQMYNAIIAGTKPTKVRKNELTTVPNPIMVDSNAESAAILDGGKVVKTARGVQIEK